MRIIFMGTPEFSVPALDALYRAGHEIVAVYSQPPRRAGRGKALRASPVHRHAETLGLSVRHPESLKPQDVQDAFAALNADVAVVVAYGLLLPQPVLDAPIFGCLNIHASLLPRWRGAAPIHRAIMAGDHETGVCIMQMEAGLDTGPVLQRVSTTIGAQETTQELHDRLALLGAAQICSALEQLPKLRPEAQALEGVTYAAKIIKDEARLDFSRPADELERKIRALSPFPGAWMPINGMRVKVLRAQLCAPDRRPLHAVSGQVLDGFTIACGEGAITVQEAQREGGRPMQADEFLKGVSLPERI